MQVKKVPRLQETKETLHVNDILECGFSTTSRQITHHDSNSLFWVDNSVFVQSVRMPNVDCTLRLLSRLTLIISVYYFISNDKSYFSSILD